MSTEAWIGAIVAGMGVATTIVVAVVQWMLKVTRCLATVIAEVREFRVAYADGCRERHAQNDREHGELREAIAQHGEDLADHELRIYSLEAEARGGG